MLDVVSARVSVYMIALYIVLEKLPIATSAAELERSLIEYGYVDENVTVGCGVAVEGNQVQLRWYNEDGRSRLIYDVYNGVHTPSSDRYQVVTGNDLTITNLTTSDESRYRCSVTDSVGIDEKTTDLKVLGKRVTLT